MIDKDRVIINTVEIENEDELFEMSNVRGDKMREPHKMKFSFYFSIKGNSRHGIRAKVLFRPDRILIDKAGNLELHGNWKFTPGKDDKEVSQSDVNDMIDFFKEYKVLFAGAWEEKIQADDVQDFFRGRMSLKQIVREIEGYEEYKEVLDKVDSIKELERVVRDNNIFNMND